MTTIREKSSASTIFLKLLRVALDPAASDAEATNAATRIILAARKRGLDAATFRAEIGVGHTEPPSRPDAGKTIMPFGRYRGKTLAEIARLDPDYIQWLADTLESRPALRRAAREVLATMEQEAV